MLTGHLDESLCIKKSIFESLYRSFVVSDRTFLRMQYSRVRATGVRSGPGGAAVVVVVAGDLLICANSGDARAVISRAGTAVPLSDDHKPVGQFSHSHIVQDRSDEQERIIKAGGWVRNRRVTGRLAVSRAFGDIEYKVSLNILRKPGCQRMLELENLLWSLQIQKLDLSKSFYQPTNLYF